MRDDDGKRGNGADREHAALTDMLVAASAVIDVIAECIKAAGSKGVPSGHVYATVMGQLSLRTYQNVIALLVHMDCVDQTGHMLTWIGPTQPPRTSDR